MIKWFMGLFKRNTVVQQNNIARGDIAGGNIIKQVQRGGSGNVQVAGNISPIRRETRQISAHDHTGSFLTHQLLVNSLHDSSPCSNHDSYSNSCDSSSSSSSCDTSSSYDSGSCGSGGFDGGSSGGSDF